MQKKIPDTVEVKKRSGSTYLAYNVHINGAFHAAVRFSDLYNFNDQLKKNFGGRISTPFPPRKILSLTPVQIEERREQLEKYLQDVCQDVDIAYSEIFSSFLRNSQKEYCNALTETVSLDIFLMNGQKISLKVVSTDSTDDVLEAAMSEINLSDDLVHYFALFLIKREEDGGASIVRKLQDYESPYLSMQELQGTYRIAVRKSFWDSKIEDKILEDKIGMNLLYVQAVSDIEKGWVVGPKEAYSRLAELKQSGSKKEYLRLARMMKYYGFIQFKPCITNYPEDNTRVLVSCGERELNFRLQTSDHKVQEGSFKVTRMRCWRITSSTISDEDNKKTDENMELAFEYLLGKDNLHWITVYSDQAILISMCLQSIVDEILRLKQGKPIKSVKKKSTKKRNDRYERCNSISSTASNEGEENKSPNSNAESTENKTSSPSPSVTTKKKSQKPAAQNYLPVPQNQVPTSKNTKTNEVFEGIGDDDL
ncbi:sorting nexin-17-like [Exaiptasia diaphana]|uniref:Sorting nexin-17 n=1 Tax=Exaiptasia diaphana TaxID=2652724 RepID=A0A913WXG4_EXADI|nr:sorting nexin-17-like [Exaiptasia diaphana]